MSGAGIARLQHLSLEVTDLDRSIAFYRDFLGLKLTERHGPGEVKAIPMEMAFMRAGRDHHDMVLIRNPKKRYEYRPRGPEEDLEGPPMFHHFAFVCEDRAAWLKMLEKARAMGLEIVRGPVVHSRFDPRGDGSWGENEAFYVLDPDNHRIEIFCDMATVDETGAYFNVRGERVEGGQAEEV